MRILIALLILPALALADTVESTSGGIIDGKVIARNDKEVVIEVQVQGKTVQRKLGIQYVKAITIDGKREVLSGPGKTTTPAAGGAQKTRAEIEALIAAAKTPPDWLEATQLNLPRTMDMSWPEKPQGGWNSQRNIGQFIWDVINPNPSRWREGVKLMHFMMEQNPNNAEIQQRAALTLGSMYQNLFQDYAHAAYWWRKAGNRSNPTALAECYWKLGNKQMAIDALNQVSGVGIGTIKLWAELGQLDRALKLVDLFQDTNGDDEALVTAGDACRHAGRTAQAIKYYQEVLSMKDENQNKRSKDRAREALQSIKLFDTLEIRKVADGTYTGSSIGYEAAVEIEVKVTGGRIESLRVTKHREKQFYSSITDTCGQIIQKQSVKGIDATSHATITSEAIIIATAKALHGGMK